MRFYKVTTTHNQEYINDIIKKMNSVETEYISKLYSRISMVEYTDETNCECMFAILDQSLISLLEKVYTKYNIQFTIIDLTKQVIFDEKFKTKYKNYNGRSTQSDILDLIKKYKLDWASKDDILDKIIEKGITSLNEIDLNILKS